MRSRVRILIFSALWMGLVSFGVAKLLIYQDTPGESRQPPGGWPSQSGLARYPGRPTLVILAHPKCPCTAATLGELARIVAECDGRLTVHVLFLKPPGSGADWSDTTTFRTANALPGVRVGRDDAGLKARMFGAATSGQALLYDTGGILRFSGGITGARGHAGDNAGHSAIVSLVNTGRAQIARTPVFGCSLL